MHIGCAVLMAISNPRRYISLRALSDTILFELILLSS